MIKFLYLLIPLLVAIIVVIVFKYNSIQENYNSIDIHMSKSEVVLIMGDPQNKYMYINNGKEYEDWLYFQYPIPKSYILHFHNEIVINKSISISP